MSELEKLLDEYGLTWKNLKKDMKSINEAVDWRVMFEIYGDTNKSGEEKRVQIKKQVMGKLFLVNGFIKIKNPEQFSNKFNLNGLFVKYPPELIKLYILKFQSETNSFSFRGERFMEEKVKEVYGEKRFTALEGVDPQYKMEALFDEHKAEKNMAKRMQQIHNATKEELEKIDGEEFFKSIVKSLIKDTRKILFEIENDFK